MLRVKGLVLGLAVLGILAGSAFAGDVDDEIDRILEKFDKKYRKLREEMRRELERVLGKKATPPAKGGAPYLGIHVEPVKEGLRVLLNLDKGEGIVLRKVVEGGPAEEAGLRKWDILLAFEGKKVGSTEDLKAALRGYRGGQRVRLSVLRDGEKIRLDMVLGSQGGEVPTPTPHTETPPGRMTEMRRHLKALMKGSVQERMRARRYFEKLLSGSGKAREKVFQQIEDAAEDLLGDLSPRDRREMRKVFEKMLSGFKHAVEKATGSQKKEDIEAFLEEMLKGGEKGSSEGQEPEKDDIDKLLDELLGKDGEKKKPAAGESETDDKLPIEIPKEWDEALTEILGEEGWNRLKEMMKEPRYREMLDQFFPEGFEFTPANVKKLLNQYGITMDTLQDRLREMGVEEDAIEKIMKLLEEERLPGEKKPAWMGIRGKTADEGQGVLVTGVDDGGPADQAGFETDDVIIMVDGRKIEGKGDLKDALEGKYAGDALAVTVLRNGRMKELRLVLGAKK